MKNSMYKGVLGWAVLLLFFFTQASYGQQDTGDFTVSSDDASNYSFDDGSSVLTVSAGVVTVSTAAETKQTIKLTGGKLVLKGVEITSDANSAISPIEVAGEAEINLADGTTNRLTSTNSDVAGIYVPEGSRVTFTGGGMLTAENTEERSGEGAAGIGGNSGAFGTIIFDLTGTVTAKGADFGAGIGTGGGVNKSSGNYSGTILIKQGTINATGGSSAAGIGTGCIDLNDSYLTVTIEGGTVNATGGETGIGGGILDYNTTHVFLLGGTVNADINNTPTLFIGPDITFDGTIGGSCPNRFVFENKTATLEGNPVFPADKSLTIGADETLTIPATGILTNNGTITNNGLIINDGTITNENDGTLTGDGAIIHTIPQGWTGNTAYIAYDANGGTGDVARTFHRPGATDRFPAATGFFKSGSSCIGWGATSDATSALSSYTVTEGANTLFALWAAAIAFTSNTREITGTVGEAFPAVYLSENISNAAAVDGVTFAPEGALPTGFSLSTDGRLSASAALTEVLSGTTVLVTVTPGNGTPPASLTLTFHIQEAPEPVYFSVTLPELEGATYDVAPGSHQVESWKDFRFYLTLKEGYREDSQPVVTIDRGETITPRVSDGAYIIKNVRQDIVVSVTGIVADSPTGIAGIDNDTATRIAVADAVLLISVPQPADACIADLSGRLIRTLRLPSGTTRITDLPAGIYIVKLPGQEGRKVIIR